MYVSATVDIGDVEDGVNAIERRARELGPAFAEIKTEMKLDQKDHREQQSGPDGSWPKRASSTVLAAKRRHKRLPRRILGKLSTAVAYTALPYGAIGESRVAWSLAQQDGDTVGHGARLPSRVFLWISDRLLRTSEVIIERFVMAAWERR